MAGFYCTSIWQGLSIIVTGDYIIIIYHGPKHAPKGSLKTNSLRLCFLLCRYSFSINRRPTIVSKSNERETLGNNNGFTDIDVRQIKNHYNCKNGPGPDPNPNPNPPPTGESSKLFAKFWSSFQKGVQLSNSTHFARKYTMCMYRWIT